MNRGLKNSMYMMAILFGTFLISCDDDESAVTTPPVDKPIAGFNMEKDEENNLTVTFTNTSIGGDSFSWDFGDGSEGSTDENTMYTYTASDSYTVKLTVTNEGGTDEIEQEISVSGFGPNLVTAGDMSDATAWTLTSLWTGEDNVMNHAFNDTAFVFLSGADGDGVPYQYSNYVLSQEVQLEAGKTYHFSADMSSVTGTNATWFEVYFLNVLPDSEEVIVGTQIALKGYGEGEDCTKGAFDGDIMEVAAGCATVNAFDQLLNAEGVFTVGEDDLSEAGTIYLVFKVGSGWAAEGEVAGFGDGLILDNVVIKEAI